MVEGHIVLHLSVRPFTRPKLKHGQAEASLSIFSLNLSAIPRMLLIWDTISLEYQFPLHDSLAQGPRP